MTFSVTAIGVLPLSYQWQKDGTDLPVATNAVLELSNVSTNAGGSYTVVVSNRLGHVTSAAAILTVNPAGVSINTYAGITLDSVPGRTFRIDSVTDLTQATNWITLTNLTLTSPVQLWIDPQSSGQPKRFYRAILLP